MWKGTGEWNFQQILDFGMVHLDLSVTSILDDTLAVIDMLAYVDMSMFEVFMERLV